jgi:hypothetical protein
VNEKLSEELVKVDYFGRKTRIQMEKRNKERGILFVKPV